VQKNSIVHASDWVLLRSMPSLKAVKNAIIQVLLVEHVGPSFVSCARNQEDVHWKQERNHRDIS
jgi:hypothetical protein